VRLAASKEAREIRALVELQVAEEPAAEALAGAELARAKGARAASKETILRRRETVLLEAVQPIDQTMSLHPLATNATQQQRPQGRAAEKPRPEHSSGHSSGHDKLCAGVPAALARSLPNASLDLQDAAPVG
jgi:hypothetical protein